MSKHAANAERFRRQAEECRVIAGMMTDAKTRDQYIELAEAYEKLAANEEEIARNLEQVAKSKPRTTR